MPPFHVQQGSHFNRAQWYSLVALFVSMLMLTGASLLYANYVATKSTQRFCSIVITLNDTYKQQPPQTETGRKFVRDMAKLERDLKCER